MVTSKRTTVLFNMDDYDLIKGEVTRRTEESGYPVTVADVLRDLVREKWKGNDDTKLTDQPVGYGHTVQSLNDWMRNGDRSLREYQAPGSS